MKWVLVLQVFHPVFCKQLCFSFAILLILSMRVDKVEEEDLGDQPEEAGWDGRKSLVSILAHFKIHDL